MHNQQVRNIRQRRARRKEERTKNKYTGLKNRRAMLKALLSVLFKSTGGGCHEA
jgi:hypothetical protein